MVSFQFLRRRFGPHSFSTFMGWVQRATQEGPGPSEGTPRVTARPVVLELGGGVRMELTDRSQLVLAAQLIQFRWPGYCAVGIVMPPRTTRSLPAKNRRVTDGDGK